MVNFFPFPYIFGLLRNSEHKEGGRHLCQEHKLKNNETLTLMFFPSTNKNKKISRNGRKILRGYEFLFGKG
jgi:hypothetical protein